MPFLISNWHRWVITSVRWGPLFSDGGLLNLPSFLSLTEREINHAQPWNFYFLLIFTQMSTGGVPVMQLHSAIRWRCRFHWLRWEGVGRDQTFSDLRELSILQNSGVKEASQEYLPIKNPGWSPAVSTPLLWCSTRFLLNPPECSEALRPRSYSRRHRFILLFFSKSVKSLVSLHSK